MKLVPTVQRLAFGEFFFLSATSKLEAYEKLSLRLPHLRLNPANSSDLFYRINRTRQVLIGGKEVGVNRLGEWTAPAITMRVKMNQVDTTTMVAFAAATKTDINTVQSLDLSDLGESDLKSVARVLFENSAELTEKGDSL